MALSDADAVTMPDREDDDEVADDGTGKEIPQPKTPDDGTDPQPVPLPTTPDDMRKREEAEPDVSPWKKPRLVVARRQGSIVPLAASLEKMASTLSKFRPAQAGPPETLLAIWQAMKSQRSSLALILGYQPQVTSFRRGMTQSSSITAWGLDGTAQWCKFSAYDDAASRFLDALETLEGGSGFMKMSLVRHDRNMLKPIEGAMAFRIENSCHFALADGFPNSESPVPALNSNLSEYANVSVSHRCFLLAKVAEVYDLDPAQVNCSAKLRLRLMDMSGHVRMLTIWPPNCHSQIWEQDAVVKKYGLTANMQYHNFSASSDAVVELDDGFTAYNFPSHILSTKWDLTSSSIQDSNH